MDVATFERSTLRWDEREQGVHADVLGVYRALIALRRAHPELADPSLTRFAVETADDDSWLVMQRGDLRVAVCFGSAAVVPLDAVVDEVLRPGRGRARRRGRPPRGGVVRRRARAPLTAQPRTSSSSISVG